MEGRIYHLLLQQEKLVWLQKLLSLTTIKLLNLINPIPSFSTTRTGTRWSKCRSGPTWISSYLQSNSTRPPAETVWAILTTMMLGGCSQSKSFIRKIQSDIQIWWWWISTISRIPHHSRWSKLVVQVWWIGILCLFLELVPLVKVQHLEAHVPSCILQRSMLYVKTSFVEQVLMRSGKLTNILKDLKICQ